MRCLCGDDQVRTGWFSARRARAPSPVRMGAAASGAEWVRSRDSESNSDLALLSLVDSAADHRTPAERARARRAP